MTQNEKNNKVIFQSLGAAQTVTGSKHLLKTPEITVMVDCGLFQGLKTLREKNWQPLKTDVTRINCLLLTHAHLDHCGYIPLLVKEGFKGTIYCSAPTRDLTEIILMDSAKIQEEDAFKANLHQYSRHEPALPLYTVDDVKKALVLFKTVENDQFFQLSPSIRVRFVMNGHILGSCSVDMECYGKKLLFSGDIGRYNSTYLKSPTVIDEPDFVIMETTYGDRLHGHADPMVQLERIVNDAIGTHGSVLIPSFAVGRAQEIMHLLSQLKIEKRIPDWLPVYMDSPMAASATHIFLRYPQWHKLTDEECQRMCSDVIINTDAKNTHDIIKKHGPKIVIASSGMLTGGRVLEYLKEMAPEAGNFIVLVGYQADGTRGRALQNHAHEIKMHGKYYPVNAEIDEITGLSGHADQGELIEWLQPYESDKKARVLLVHGEPQAMDTFRVKIKTLMYVEPRIPKENEEILLFETE